MLDLAEAHGAKGILFFSSSEIYGDPDPQYIRTPEHYRGNVSCTGPRACYDESKRLGETLCISFWGKSGWREFRTARPSRCRSSGTAAPMIPETLRWP